MSFFINCPFQEYNNHAIILTNSGTGKSTSFERITGELPAEGFSVPGLLGAAEQSKGGKWTVTTGSLSGSGTAVFDEFPNKKDPIVPALLGYLRKGQGNRELAARVNCNGTKAVVFLGNYNKLCAEDLQSNIVSLATSKALDRVSNRFGHILYGYFKPVGEHKENEFKSFYYRTIINYMILKNERKINSLFRRAESWIQKSDKKYSEFALNYSEYVKYDSMRSFIRGFAAHIPRVRCGGLKRAILEHLDKIDETLSTKIVWKELIKPSAEHYYTLFKQLNKETIKKLEIDRKTLFKKSIEKHLSKKEICYICGITLPTYKSWLEEIHYNQLLLKPIVKNKVFL